MLSGNVMDFRKNERIKMKQEYNRLLARFKKGEPYIDSITDEMIKSDPKYTDHIQAFGKLLIDMETVLMKIGTSTERERKDGFNL